VRDAPAILALRARVHDRGKRRWVLIAAAACAAVVLLGVAVQPLRLRLAPPAPSATVRVEAPTQFETKVGQLSRLVLSDGSMVVLDANSLLSVQFGADNRELTLERGRAFFQVAHESRPFIVSTNRFSVRATGTQFVVDRASDSETVGMIEGSVEAIPAGPIDGREPVRLTAGTGLVDSGHGPWVLAKVNIEAERNWMDGRLVFFQEKVGHIAEQMNRYSQQKIVIADTALANSPLDAVIQAGDVNTLVSSLSDLGMARITARTPTTIVLASPKTQAPPPREKPNPSQ
jgi:transmembrane sensor